LWDGWWAWRTGSIRISDGQFVSDGSEQQIEVGQEELAIGCAGVEWDEAAVWRQPQPVFDEDPAAGGQASEIKRKIGLLLLESEIEPMAKGGVMARPEGSVRLFFAEHLGQAMVFIDSTVGTPPLGEIHQTPVNSGDLA